MKCTQDPSRASLQFIWTLSCCTIKLLFLYSRREVFLLQIYLVMFSFVWESCNYLWFSCTTPKKLFKWKFLNERNFFCCKIHFKWKMSSSSTNEPTPRGDFRIFICISNDKYVSINFIHNSLCFSCTCST